MIGGAARPSGGFGDEPVAHLAQALHLGLHDVARLEEGVGALADAAAGAAAPSGAGTAERRTCVAGRGAEVADAAAASVARVSRATRLGVSATGRAEAAGATGARLTGRARAAGAACLARPSARLA